MRFWHKNRSIHIKLFKGYSVLILLFTLFILFFVYNYVLSRLEDRYYGSMQSLSVSISNNIDNEIKKLDNYSLCIQYSRPIKTYFSNHLSNINDSDSLSDQLIIQEQDSINGIVEALMTLIGPNMGVSQVNLYDFFGEVIGAGVYSQKRTDDVRTKPWYHLVMERAGQRIITLPEDDEFLSELLHKEKKFISLKRVYFDAYNQKQGILELKQDCDVLFGSLNELVNEDTMTSSVFVYNEKNQMVYPYIDNSYLNYMEIIKSKPSLQGYMTISSPASNKKEVIAYAQSEYTGWTVVVVLLKSVLMSPLVSVIKLVLIVTVAVLLLTLIVSYFMARQFTVPIKKIHSQIKKYDLNYIPNEKQQRLNSNFDELEELNDAFQNMHLKLKQSVKDMLTSQEREIQSKLLALQSQMNPHFLHNTLANICMMAEENLNEEIVKMCKNVSHMLRYISTDKFSTVELKTEMEYTVKYLECMKTRYGQNLVYRIEIPEEMFEIQVPKLTIQPLVENSLKYGIHVEPPWIIEVCGHWKDEQWVVDIKDNGLGFSEEKIHEIREKLDDLNTQHLSGMELDGLGIVNIYARLNILYKEMAVFEINNLKEGGASITIGGRIRRAQSEQSAKGEQT